MIRDPRQPLDYAEDDLPASSRPMFRVVEIVLLASLVGVAIVCLWIGLTWGR
jgi:hypothetical protein